MDGFFSTFFESNGFWAAFTSSLVVIIATELGDRTFFIAAIMAMKSPRLLIWSSALAALALMTLISCIFGMTAIALIPKIYVHITVVGIMLFFGFQLLRNGYKMKKDEVGFDELEEVEESMKVDSKDVDLESGSKVKILTRRGIYAVALQAFTMTFLAEWGDRSQLATIALSAQAQPFGVLVGGVVGHALCTGIAVIGGRLIANYISERTVTLGGGLLFLFFGLYGMCMDTSSF
eukprot:TRINITY_DN1073_c0_g1_i1.p1 TRINITY_DN1073_c0_g1~~TRINITY_DN1073_c0_g1_i1.p1  ORF type:complete len:234 (+),score=85.46 TRINITY_DN1073_c0_g1_i1:152-853(+)